MFATKSKAIPFSSISESVFKNHCVIWGDNDLKSLKILEEFVVGLGSKSQHSISICTHLEAEFIRRNLGVDTQNHRLLSISLSPKDYWPIQDNQLVKPVQTFDLMISALQKQQAESHAGGEGTIWYGRAISTFIAMKPYIASVFTEYKAVPGVDITDTACLVKTEKRVPLSALKQAMLLKPIKQWLLLEKESKERDTLYNAVDVIPGFCSLSETNPEEAKHFGYLTMMAMELLNCVAPMAEYSDELARMSSMVAVHSGHIVISVPDDPKHNDSNFDLAYSILLDQITNALAPGLVEDVEEDNQSATASSPKPQFKSPVYMSAPMVEHIRPGVIFDQIRALGYVVGIRTGLGDSEAFQERFVDGSKPHAWSDLVLDHEASQFYEHHNKHTAKLGRKLDQSTGLYICKKTGKAHLVKWYE